jgi:hypothetical protein
MAVTSLKHWIHFRLSSRCPPTSNILKQKTSHYSCFHQIISYQGQHVGYTFLKCNKDVKHISLKFLICEHQLPVENIFIAFMQKKQHTLHPAVKEHSSYNTVMGLDGSVCIATCYRLDGLGTESLCGRDSPRPSGSALGPTQTSVQWVRSLFPGIKWTGHGIGYSPPSSAEVKGVEL